MSAPKAPDPVATANAQAAMNKETAIAQQGLNSTNQVNPWGNVTYAQTGKWEDGTPQFTQTTSLSPQQQAIFNQTQGAEGNLAQLANQQSGFLKDYLKGTADLSGVPALQYDMGQQGLGQGFNAQFGGGVGGGFNSQFNQGAGSGYNSDFGGSIGSGFNTSYSGGAGNGFNTQFGQDVGNGYNSQFGGGIGGSFENQANLQNSYSGADDFSADRDSYTNALLARNAPQRAQDDAALTTRLKNQGIQEGSAAWNAEMERMARQRTDENYAAILAGGQEQGRMVDMARQAAQFGNDATLAGLGFGNNASLQQAQFGQNAQNATNAAAMAQAQFGAGQQQAQNAASLAQQQQIDNQTNLQNNAALQQAQFGSGQQQQQNAANMAQQQWMAQLQQSQNDAALQGAQFGSQQQQNQNNALVQGAGFNNQANAANAQFNNQSAQQGIQNAYTARNQPINELASLMGLSQVQNPAQMSGATPQTGVAGVDYSGLVNNNYNQQVASNNAMLGGVGGLFGTLLGRM